MLHGGLCVDQLEGLLQDGADVFRICLRGGGGRDGGGIVRQAMSTPYDQIFQTSSLLYKEGASLFKMSMMHYFNPCMILTFKMSVDTSGPRFLVPIQYKQSLKSGHRFSNLAFFIVRGTIMIRTQCLFRLNFTLVKSGHF